MMDGGDQRRLSAILAADVVGYTEHMERDTDGTVAAWKAARTDIIDPSISNNAGRIVKHTGDGFLVEFSTVLDAVNCAISLQQELSASPLDFRMGVNLGDIIDDGEDIHGEGVNIAARIEGLCEPGGIWISGSVHEQVRNRLDHRFEDMGAHEVKHVSAPVQVFRVVIDGVAPTKVKPEQLAELDKPAIAVLPFDNMSGEPEQEYFSDGITEDIITELSRFREFLVIARNSSFAYKGGATDLKAVARELNARYIVEGSVRKAGNRVRVTAQLIEGATNTHLWADRFDGDLTDIFALQDEITQAIVSAVAPRSVQAEAERSAKLSPTQLSSWDSLLRARAVLAALDREGVLEAMPVLQTAIRQDPRNAQAHSWLAFGHFVHSVYGWSDDPVVSFKEAVADARQAVSLDPDDALSHVMSGLVEGAFKNDVQTAGRAYEEALRINPNFAMAHGFMGGNQAIRGNFAAARIHLDLAGRLSPRDPSAGMWHVFYNIGLYSAGRYDDVIKDTDQAIRTNLDYAALYRQRAAALAMLGREEEARDNINQVLRLDPGATIKRAGEMPFWPDVEPFLDGLRKAGLPE